ncbi:MAG: 3-dehydro-L-gulonate 2-dehydrogenase [Daejeonella sp.]|uniref:3-dehydro-L-gulonate 2-dehydrogenase n=1 Tax=Daejeonella sp. TaxID=2805397 RepID=UPI0027347A15|nr:3-dehydro-L-gulonate 2-dehydrogenase [Daejeonella sp.]MDP3469465.1 3-dehydro-L-gulonate 2-dehydrogenase [Daejeonella sp.]
MKVPFADLKKEFKRVLLSLSFTEEKAELCADIFAGNSRDGVYSHGLNRFSAFVNAVKEGEVDIHAEPGFVESYGMIEIWDGNSGAGMYNATKAMNRTIDLAKSNGIGCLAMRNTNHWMRGGTYGWQAADAGCIGICFTNTMANMPPWGGKEPRLGNNPLIIAVPRTEGHIVLDMAMTQFSYGKLQQSRFNNEEMEVFAGYDMEGNLTKNPLAIIKSRRALPIGYWKGSGLAFVLDVLLTAISGGKSTAAINSTVKESGVSQFFLCLHKSDYNQMLIEEIIRYTKSSSPAEPGGSIYYPGENTLATRRFNEKHGIPVEERIWEELLKM